MSRPQPRIVPSLGILSCLMIASPALADSSNGVWLPGQPPQLHYHSGFLDTPRDRLVFVGGIDGPAFSETPWTYSLPSGSWAPLATSGPGPAGRYAPAVVHDTVHERIILFGGWQYEVSLNDVWFLNLSGTPSWQEVVPGGPAPSPRTGHAGVFDPTRNRALFFGGGTGGNELWELNLDPGLTWQQLSPSNPPSGREGQVAIYDDIQDRLIIFGGDDGNSYQLDTWALDLSNPVTWVNLNPAGTPPPNPYYGVIPGAVMDAARNRMVVISHSSTSRLYQLNLSGPPAWSQIPAANSLASSFDSAFILDVPRSRFIVNGGRYDGSCETWAIGTADSSSWVVLPPGQFPPPRSGPAGVYDSTRDRLVQFGGGVETCEYPYPLDDTWVLNLWGHPRWSRLLPSGLRPTRRQAASAILDPVQDRMIVFGGHTSFYSRLNDVWSLSLSGTPVWSKLLPSGSAPTARTHHTAVHDPVRNRMVVFGGSISPSPYRTNDTWVLDLSGPPQWQQLFPVGGPPAVRYDHVAVYDPVRDRMVVHGGEPGDTWALSLSGTPTWTQISAPGGPPVMTRPAGFYDPVRDRFVVSGGSPGGIYALSFSPVPAWSQLSPDGLAPPNRNGHIAFYDVQRDRMILSGGVINYCQHNRQDMGILQWGDPSGVGEAVGQRNSLVHALSANPFRSFVDFTLDAIGPERALIEIFDVIGRHVRSIADEGRGAARVVRWDGRNNLNAALPSGLYFYRIASGNREASGQIVKLP